MHCCISPLASLIPATFGMVANLNVVAAVILRPVLPGTLYKRMGLGDAAARAL